MVYSGLRVWHFHHKAIVWMIFIILQLHTSAILIWFSCFSSLPASILPQLSYWWICLSNQPHSFLIEFYFWNKDRTSMKLHIAVSASTSTNPSLFSLHNILELKQTYIKNHAAAVRWTGFFSYSILRIWNGEMAK